MKRLILVSSFYFLFSACGSVENLSLGEIDVAESSALGEVYLFATDYVSAGQLYTTSVNLTDELSNTGVSGLGSSAIIRYYEDLLYILHDGFSSGSSDNVQIINPDNGYETVNQWSTGNGTNPHDIVVLDNKAYISLYNPDNDPLNIDENGNPGDLIVMNLDTGSVESRISFTGFLNDDEARLAMADRMVLVDNLLYVCLQDLESDFSQNASGKIGVVNVSTNEIEEMIPLQGRNPVGFVYSEDQDKFFVALEAPYDYSLGNFDTSGNFGGVEIISRSDPGVSTLIADDDLGGYVERLVLGEGEVFVVVSQMDSATFEFTSEILVLPEEAASADDVDLFLSQSSDVREIAVDSQNRLWISRREISADEDQASDPQVEVFNADTGEKEGETLIPLVPVVSITFGAAS